MKKILCSLMFLPLLAAAQTEVKNKTISPYVSISEPTSFGISFEFPQHKKDTVDGDFYKSKLLNVGATTMAYEEAGLSVDGSGFVIEIGGRGYFSDAPKGLYTENLLSYSATKFDENIGGIGQFKGTYSYWSIIAPSVGYKLMLGNVISIDPSIGFNWKWEVKGKGDVDNKNVDNFVFKAGVKLGYNF